MSQLGNILELRDYSRRQKPQVEEPHTFPKQNQEFDPNLEFIETQHGNDGVEPQGKRENSPVKKLPIAKRELELVPCTQFLTL